MPIAYGQLRVAVDGDTLAIELESPALNIAGFEYQPRTAEEKERVHASAGLLGDGARLFVPASAADCRLTEAHVDSKLLGKPHDPEAEHDHDGERHDDGDHDEEHDHGGERRHSDFFAGYTFTCRKPAALTHLDVNLFPIFPAMERLESHYATANGQGAATLTPDAPRLTF